MRTGSRAGLHIMNRRDKSIWKRLGGLGRPGETGRTGRIPEGCLGKTRMDKVDTWMDKVDTLVTYMDYSPY